MSNSKLHHTVCCITISLTWTVLLLILSLLYYIISKLNILVWYQTGPDRTSYYLYLFIGCISATMVNVSPAYAMAIHQRQQLTLAEVQRGLRIALLQRDVQNSQCVSYGRNGEMGRNGAKIGGFIKSCVWLQDVTGNKYMHNIFMHYMPFPPSALTLKSALFCARVNVSSD